MEDDLLFALLICAALLLLLFAHFFWRRKQLNRLIEQRWQLAMARGVPISATIEVRLF